METKKVCISRRGHMNVEIYYDFGIEVEVPVNLDESEVEDYVEENEELNKQFDEAFQEGIQKIHNKLEAVELEYDEEGGSDEIWVEEV